MQYLITMTDIEGKWKALPQDRKDRILKQHEEFRAALEAEGRFIGAYHLHSSEEARTLRMDDAGQMTTRAGPFREGAEGIGGLYIIEADSMEEALAWARRGRFMVGANEVRQIHTE